MDAKEFFRQLESHQFISKFNPEEHFGKEKYEAILRQIISSVWSPISRGNETSFSLMISTDEARLLVRYLNLNKPESIKYYFSLCEGDLIKDKQVFFLNKY